MRATREQHQGKEVTYLDDSWLRDDGGRSPGSRVRELRQDLSSLPGQAARTSACLCGQ